MGIVVEDIGKGTYTLILFLKEPVRLKIGALGEVYFHEGYYAYTGSALGSGGFVRVKRHKTVAAGRARSGSGTSTTCCRMRRSWTW
jgi:hypothetical protein